MVPQYRLVKEYLPHMKESSPEDDGAHFAHSQFIENYVSEHNSEFIEEMPIRVMVLTWNVCSADPMGAVASILNRYITDDLDFICVGLQEVDMSFRSVVLGDVTNRNALEDGISGLLKTSDSFDIIHSRHFGSLSLIIYAKKHLRPHIQGVTSSCHSVALFKTGNKGAIAVSISFIKDSLCFVCSHFPAHTKNVALRNEAFNNVSSKIAFKVNGKEITLDDHQFVFWFGDLNYRLEISDSDLSSSVISSGVFDFDLLKKYDQLTSEREKSKAFGSYQEAPILFPPTYKLDIGTTSYLSDEEHFPSWTDRILWRCYSPEAAFSLDYSSVEALPISDHFPVISRFLLSVSLINSEKYKAVSMKASQEASRFLNRLRPEISLSTQDVQFEEVHFYVKKTSTILVTNEGSVDVSFSIYESSLQDSNSSLTSPSWMTFPLRKQSVARGETTEILFTAFVDEDVNRWAQLSGQQLEVILVIKVKGGRDFFVTLTANYVRGCFGFPLEELVKSNAPIKALPPSSLDIDQSVVSPALAVSIPIQLLSMTSHILNYGRNETGLFASFKVCDNVVAVMNILDTDPGYNLPEDFPCFPVSHALLLFFKALPFPLVSLASLNVPIMDLNTLLDDLKPPYNCVLRHLLLFLKELLYLSNSNKLTARTLGNSFGPILFNQDVFDAKYDPKQLRDVTSKIFAQYLSM